MNTHKSLGEAMKIDLNLKKHQEMQREINEMKQEVIEITNKLFEKMKDEINISKT